MGCVFVDTKLLQAHAVGAWLFQKKKTAGGDLSLFVGNILVRESPLHNIEQKYSIYIVFDVVWLCAVAKAGHHSFLKNKL